MGMSVAADRVRTRAHADEAALVERVRAGDEAAYEHLVRVHGPRMLAVARRFFAVDADARDAVQDAFVCVCRSIARFQGQCLLSTWLHRVVVNAALTRLRSQRRRPEAFLEDLFPRSSDLQATGLARSAVDTAEEAMFRGEVQTRVRESIERLPEIYRGVVRLRDIDGLEVPAIGDLLEIGAWSAKTRLRRGRIALRRLLRPFERNGRPR